MGVLGLEVSQRYEQRLWPGLVGLAKILALPVAGLETAVEREVAENPALERDRDDGAECAVPCGWCERGAAPRPQGDAADVAAPPTGELLAQARVLLGGREAGLAEYILSSLDERGLLGHSLAQIGRETGATRAELENVVAALRSVGPVSIAARDVREALLLQLDAMGTEAPALARRLVSDHMRELGTGAFTATARALGVSRAEVVEARDFIRTWLRPPSGVHETSSVVGTTRPDMMVRPASDGELEVDLPDVRHVRVRVDPLWKECAQNAGRADAERALARDLVARAHRFARSLEDRHKTLKVIAEYTVWRQDRFARGHGAPLPLTRAAVARGVGVHESTVSRAVMGKLVQLETGRVVELASFFQASLGLEQALARLVAAEQRPLSDGELAVELGRLGYPLARRTVTKYRARLGIVPHTVR